MPLWLCLGLLIIACIVFRAYQPAFATVALLVNWGICAFVSKVLGYQFNYMLLSSIDVATAAVLLFLPHSKWPLLLVFTYVAALCAHAFFALVGPNPYSEHHYWWAMHYVAWSQFWIALAWGSYDTGRRIVGRGDNRRGLDTVDNLSHPLAGVNIRSGGEA